VVKLPFGDAKLPDELRRKLEQGPGGHKAGKDVIVGIRPEAFEDAGVETDPSFENIKFRTKVDVVESMGSELFVYYDVQGENIDASELAELAKDAGMEDLPSHGGGQQVVARLDAASKARAGGEVELILDTTHIHLFDPDGGRSLTALHREAAPTASS
jgi:multiple sugar transport system ATP-binding protein